MKTQLVSALLVAFLLAGCGRPCEDGVAWTPVEEDALDTTQNMQRANAFAAKDLMFKQLSGALMKAIQESGPAAAIGVCREQAPSIATSVSEKTGVRIGRTAFKLRNAENTPPAWAASLVEAQHADNAYRVAPDGRLGVFLPIRLQQPCLTCHGDVSKIADDVKAQIDELYPDDQAMGFAQGDLRGWFWVEVPAPAQ